MPVAIFYDAESRTVLAELSGDIDHCSAASLRAPVDEEVMKRLPLRLMLDFENVPFMDSSGIGLIIGRSKLITDLGGSLIVVNPKPEVRRIMELAGVGRLCSIVFNEHRTLIGGMKI
ncbi:MAG: anti-sigma factor antagonist [Ruminococcus sp.]|nr:anti-sigma factor antagonist [Ruminococcus sp.]